MRANRQQSYTKQTLSVMEVKWPTCFGSVWEYLDWVQANLECRKNAAKSYCTDCTAKYQKKMIEKSRCEFPETEFVRREDHRLLDPHVIGVRRTMTEITEKVYGILKQGKSEMTRHTLEYKTGLSRSVVVRALTELREEGKVKMRKERAKYPAMGHNYFYMAI